MHATSTPQDSHADTPQISRPFFISLRVKLLVIFLLLFALLFGGAFLWFHEFATNAVRTRLESDLDTILSGMATQIDGDEFAKLVEAGRESPAEGYYPPQADETGQAADPASELYWKHAAFLYQQRRIIGDDRIRFYTFIASDAPGEVVFIGSSDALAVPQGGAKFYERWKPTTLEESAVILAGLQEKTLYLQIYEDDFGEWISGYAPIQNSTGQTVGAVGVDFLASYVEEVQRDVENGIVLAAGIISILVIIMVFLIAGFLTRPMITLARVASRIGEGDYEQDLSGLTPGRFSDEIGSLASVFEIMVGKVAKREEKLKQQVAELQIMIDESKRQEQVQEIVDTDFFRDLQEKARVMREDFANRAGKPSTETPPEA